MIALWLGGLAQAAQESTPPDSTTQDPIPAGLTSPQAESFADHLVQSDPYNALTFYRLALFLDEQRHDALQFKIGLSYELGERHEAAAYSYGLVGGRLKERATYREAITTFRSGEVGYAELLFSEIPQDLTLPMLHLQSADLQAARRVVQGRDHPLSQALGQVVPRRSPGLATTLSLVPGLGQLYAGHVGDGIMAAVVNGTLAIWSTTLLVDGIQSERWWQVGAGGVLAGAFTITYPSNLVGAWRGAQRFNDHEERRRAEEILEEAWDPTLGLDPRDEALP